MAVLGDNCIKLTQLDLYYHYQRQKRSQGSLVFGNIIMDYVERARYLCSSWASC